jgi:hypothetical protein
MAGLKKNLVAVELTNGDVIGPERIIFADKIRLERTARANNWDLSRDEIRMGSFFAYAVLERIGQLPREGMTYEELLPELIDVQVSSEEPSDDEDPTPADTSA